MRSIRSLVIALVAGYVVVLTSCSPHIRGGGSSAITVLEKVNIGGMNQWFMANGARADLPVLLWLHGGPGAAQMPVARYFNGNLESEFIVVHWDQRGAGKSNPSDFDDSSMTFERYLKDVHEITRYLKKRFTKDRIYLLGHSWGTHLGLAAVHRFPEDYIAYIGVSQISHTDSGQIVAYREVLRRIHDTKSKRDLEHLELLDGPPYRNHSDYVAFARLIDSYGMGMDVGAWRLLKVALDSGVYSLADFRRWLRGANRGSGPMWDELQGVDILEWVPSVEVPCYFIMGEKDYNTPAELIDRLMQNLEAPYKELIVFENAAHTPFFANPDLFYRILQDIKSR